MHTVVTGGAGFIGSHIAKRLLELNHEVTIIDDLSSGYYKNIPKGAHFYKQNVLNIKARDLLNVDVIFNNAASKKNICLNNPHYDIDVNGKGTLNMLLEAKKAGVKSFIHASTGSVYGEANTVITENTQTNPVSYYGVSKLAGEKYVMLFKNNMNIVILRYFHVYGDGQENDPNLGGVIAIFNRQISEGKPITIHGDGNQKRVFTHVDNVVDANINAWEKNITGEIFNCANDKEISINEVVRMLNYSKIEYKKPLEGDIYNFKIDNSKIRKHLDIKFKGFNPYVY